MNTPIQSAAAVLGSATALARALGVTAPAVSEWSSGRRAVPPARCVQIERITEGAVRRWDLRPHDWGAIWPELIGSEGAPHWPNPKEAAACLA